MTKSDIEGKIALVTGASKGIGRSVALELANKGVRVAINYHTSDKAAEDHNFPSLWNTHFGVPVSGSIA